MLCRSVESRERCSTQTPWNLLASYSTSLKVQLFSLLAQLVFSEQDLEENRISNSKSFQTCDYCSHYRTKIKFCLMFHFVYWQLVFSCVVSSIFFSSLFYFCQSMPCWGFTEAPFLFFKGFFSSFVLSNVVACFFFFGKAELAECLERDGFKSILEAVGADCR